MKVTVVEVSDYYIKFSNGYRLLDHHYQDCCESHYLDFSHLSLSDFEGLEFDLSSPDTLFEKVVDFGIRLTPTNGHPVFVPGYASNNGYYSSNLYLVLRDDKGKTVWKVDISECQEWRDEE